jgi:hypothetical protein
VGRSWAAQGTTGCIALGVGLIAAMSPCRAEWEFTRWGMSPEQVIAASQGTVSIVPSASRERSAEDHWEMSARGKHLYGQPAVQVAVDVAFLFDTGGAGLKCVLFNALGQDAVAVKAILVARYGAPSAESEFMGSRSSVWTKPDAIEYTLGTKPVAAVVMHCAPP